MLTSSPVLKDGDSRDWTAMPGRENVPGRVHVAVVSDTALTAGPFPYSQPIDALRAAERAAGRTGAGGVRLVHLFEHDACVCALVGQHRLQLAPAGIQHRLGHRGFGKLRGSYIAHDDRAAALDQHPAELVQGIPAPVGDLGVNGPDTGLLARALCNGQCRFQVAVEAAVLQPGAIAASGHVFQAQVDADGVLSERGIGLDFNDRVEVPAATGVLGEAAGAELEACQAIAIPHLARVAVVVDLSMLPGSRTGLERNPAE